MSVGESLAARVSNRTKGARQFLFDRHRAVSILCTLVSIVAGLAAWQLASLRVPPLFLPSPLDTWQGFLELLDDGTLGTSILASSARILVGWGLGVAVGVPLGIFMGYFRWVRRLFDPYIEFFRFIPPIAFVTLAVIWLGPGEASKVALIFYTTVFIVTLNTIAGTVSVPELRLRAAASLGAGPLTTLRTVIVPSTVPYMVTGAPRHGQLVSYHCVRRNRCRAGRSRSAHLERPQLQPHGVGLRRDHHAWAARLRVRPDPADCGANVAQTLRGGDLNGQSQRVYLLKQ